MTRKKQTSPKTSDRTGPPDTGKARQKSSSGASKGKKASIAARKETEDIPPNVSGRGKVTPESPAIRKPASGSAASSVREKGLGLSRSAKSSARGDGITRGAVRGAVRPKAADVVVSSFKPERGIAILEFRNRRVRYTREKTPDQVVAMADYLRARRGFSSDQEMAEILEVHRTRLAAWKQGTEAPNPQNAQLLSYLAVVVNELEEFLDPDVIPDWLLTRQYALGGETPVRALREGQLAEVLQAANATEHGAYI